MENELVNSANTCSIYNSIQKKKKVYRKGIPKRVKIKKRIIKSKKKNNFRIIQKDLNRSDFYKESLIEGSISPEKEEEWHLEFKGINIKEIDDKFKTIDFFKSFWYIKNFIVEDNLKKHFEDKNFELLKKKKNINNLNPYKTLNWDIEFIDNQKEVNKNDSVNINFFQNKNMGTSYFKGCGCNLCLESKDCSANIKIEYFYNKNQKEVLCNVFKKGKHSHLFYPSFTTMRKLPNLNKIIEKNLYETNNVITKKIDNFENKINEKEKKKKNKNKNNDNNKLVNSPDNTKQVNWRSISNKKYYEKTKIIGKESLQFQNSVDILKKMNKTEIKKWNSIEKLFIGSDEKNIPMYENIENMNIDQFKLIYFNKEIVKENIDNLYCNMGLDACFKLGEINDKVHSPIPVVTICCPNEKGRGTICFVMNILPFNSDNLVVCLANIFIVVKEIYKEVHGNYGEFNPLFTIDKGDVEMASLNLLGVDYTLCNFFFIKFI
jgi:hypothetical protein